MSSMTSSPSPSPRLYTSHLKLSQDSSWGDQGVPKAWERVNINELSVLAMTSAPRRVDDEVRGQAAEQGNARNSRHA